MSKLHVPESASRFLNSEDLPEKIDEWRNVIRNRENGGFSYNAWRDEVNEPNVSTTGTIEEIHKTSFIQDVIPAYIEKNKPNKTKILILGSGSGVHANRIRAAFSDNVDVFTTGLKKKPVRKYIKTQNKNLTDKEKKLALTHKDLKWPSILMTYDFPEFDLIIDSQGEQYYSTNKIKFGELSSDFPNKVVGIELEKTEKYYTAVVSKLKPGGRASIAPIVNEFKKQVTEVLERLKPVLGFTYQFTNYGKCLEINKI